MNYREQTKLIDEFYSLVRSYWEIKPTERTTKFLDFLPKLEKVKLRGNSSNRETLCRSLISILHYDYIDDLVYQEKVDNLLLKYARENEKYNLITSWGYHPTTGLERFLAKYRWKLPLICNEYFGNAIKVALKFKHSDWLAKFLTDFDQLENAVTYFSYVFSSDDKEIQTEATTIFYQLNSAQQLEVLARLAENLSHSSLRYAERDERLNLLIEHNYYTPEFSQANVVVAVVKGEFLQLQNESDEVIEILVSLIDSDLAEQSKRALRQLQTKEGQGYLCEIFIHNQFAKLEPIVTECNYEPADSVQKALYFLLMEKHDRYDIVDFDRRLMRAYYENASSEMRRRIVTAVRQSGRAEYAEILSLKQTSFAVDISGEQAKAMLSVLTQNAQWEKIWRSVFELPFSSSIAALGKLLRSGWLPSEATDLEIFQKLKTLLVGRVSDYKELEKHLPVAVRVAHLQSPHKLNDFCFFPSGTNLAVADDSGKVIFWDFGQGKQTQTLSRFAEPVGRLKFTPEGTLFCLEDSPTPNLHAWDTWDKYATLRLVVNSDTKITSFELLKSGQLLLIDIFGRAQILEIATSEYLEQLPFLDVEIGWSYPQHNLLLLVDKNNLSMLNLTDFNIERTFPLPQFHSTKFFTLMPDGFTVLIGRMFGQIFAWNTQHVTPSYDSKFYTTNPYINKGELLRVLTTLPKHELVVIGDAAGNLAFNSYVREKWSARFHTPSGQLTKLELSADGNFMAIGESASEISLWDLRPLDIQKLLVQPFSQATAQHLATLKLIIENSAELPATVKNALSYMQEILQYRFRFAIEVETTQEIAPGDFDIEL